MEPNWVGCLLEQQQKRYIFPENFNAGLFLNGYSKHPRPWCWERLKAEEEEDSRGWGGWMASPTWWTWVWAGSWCWWWTGKPGMLHSVGSQRVGHNWVTEMNWTKSRITQGTENQEDLTNSQGRNNQSSSNPEMFKCWTFQTKSLKQVYNHETWIKDEHSWKWMERQKFSAEGKIYICRKRTKWR